MDAWGSFRLGADLHSVPWRQPLSRGQEGPVFSEVLNSASLEKPAVLTGFSSPEDGR